MLCWSGAVSRLRIAARCRSYGAREVFVGAASCRDSEWWYLSDADSKSVVRQYIGFGFYRLFQCFEGVGLYCVVLPAGKIEMPPLVLVDIEAFCFHGIAQEFPVPPLQ